MIAIFKGSYLIFGEEVEPSIKLLSPREHALFVEGSILCHKYQSQHRFHMERTFGKGIDTAFVAWDEPTMRMIGESYEGPQQAKVRALAAAIVLNIPFQILRERQSGPQGGEGGQRVLAEPQPSKPRPGGAAVAVA